MNIETYAHTLTHTHKWRSRIVSFDISSAHTTDNGIGRRRRHCVHSTVHNNTLNCHVAEIAHYTILNCLFRARVHTHTNTSAYSLAATERHRDSSRMNEISEYTMPRYTCHHMHTQLLHGIWFRLLAHDKIKRQNCPCSCFGLVEIHQSERRK